MLHHLFVELVKHVLAVIAREGAYSIEFSVGPRRRTLSVGFWEGKRFVCMSMLHCRRDVPPTKGYIDLMSRLLSAISGDATIICCGGSNADSVKVLDKSPGRKAGVQYPFALTAVQFERLLHRPSFSVMGRIDMFSMLRALLFRLNGLLDERWVQSTQFFRIVRIGNNSLWLPWEYGCGMIFLSFVGHGGWKVRVADNGSCGSGEDHSLASNCHVHQQYQSTSRISICGREGVYFMHMIACR